MLGSKVVFDGERKAAENQDERVKKDENSRACEIVARECRNCGSELEYIGSCFHCAEDQPIK